MFCDRRPLLRGQNPAQHRLRCGQCLLWVLKICASLCPFHRGLCGRHGQVKVPQYFCEFEVVPRKIGSGRALSFLELLLCWQCLRAVFSFLYRHLLWIYTLTASMRTGGMSLRPDSSSSIRLPQRHWQSGSLTSGPLRREKHQH